MHFSFNVGASMAVPEKQTNGCDHTGHPSTASARDQRRIQIFSLPGRRHPTYFPPFTSCYPPCEQSDARPQYHFSCKARRSLRSRKYSRPDPTTRSFRPRLVTISPRSNLQQKVVRHLNFDREVPTEDRLQRVLLSPRYPSLLARLGLFPLSGLVQRFKWARCGRQARFCGQFEFEFGLLCNLYRCRFLCWVSFIFPSALGRVQRSIVFKWPCLWV